jgi:hypothetical protein
MKTTDLRIGNLVLSKGVPVQIEEIMWETVRYCYGEFPIDYIQPVPITEEWLLRFGFEFKVVYGNNFWTLNNILIFEDKNGNFEYSVGLKIQSIHQLQNLYFALTGKELQTQFDKL